MILGLSKLGLDAGLVKYLPGSKNRNGLYSTIVMITLGIALVISAVFFAYIAVTSIYSVQNTAFISIRRADLSLIQNLLLGARIPILLLIAGLGVFGVFSSLGIAFLLTFVFGAFVLRRYGLSFTRSFDIASIRKTLKFSLGNYSAGIFMMAPVTIIPIMIVNTIGAEEGAYFYVAYSVAALLFMIPNAVSTSLFV